MSSEEAKCTRIVYILLGFFLGGLGVHNFVAGYTKKAVIQLCITIISLGLLAFVSGIWALIDIITVKEDANGVTMG